MLKNARCFSWRGLSARVRGFGTSLDIDVEAPFRDFSNALLGLSDITFAAMASPVDGGLLYSIGTTDSGTPSNGRYGGRLHVQEGPTTVGEGWRPFESFD